MALMLLVATLNLVDRYVINILAEPIKNELGLMDWQLGLLTGLAFALFYTFLGVPIARYAERGHRPRIIATAIVVWSAFTALCGLAQNFIQLFLARIGVGSGEAGCTPPSHSLITDYAPPEKRASALAFFQMGAPLGSMVGMAVGGLAADAFGWRAAFFICAVPGILVGMIVALTLVEPRRILADLPRPVERDRPGFGETLRVLSGKPTFWPLALGITITAFVSYGHGPFTASFFFRNHAAEVAALASLFRLEAAGFLGLALGIGAGLGGVLGTLCGGWLADRRSRTDKRAWLEIPAWGAFISLPIYVAALLIPSVAGAIALLFIYQVVAGLQQGPIFASVMSIAPYRMRATASAIVLLIISLVGLGLGPLAVGAASDLLAIKAELGTGEGLRWALVASTVPALAAAGLYWKARSTLTDDLEG